MRRFLFFAGTGLLAIVLAALLISWLRNWITRTSINVAQTFGWGIVLTALAILIILVVALSRPILLVRWWNKWIGLLILFASIWAMLAFFSGSGYLTGHSLGGEIGLSLIGTSRVISVLIVIGLVIAGLFFIIPRKLAGAIVSGIGWSANHLRRRSNELSGMPVPTPQIDSRSLARDTARTGELKNTSFPRFVPVSKPRPQYPVNGSKNWLWNRLHSRPESPAPAPGTGSPEIESSALPARQEEDISSQDETAQVDQAESGIEVDQATSSGSEKAAKENPIKASGPGKDVTQIAQEVWKKYGETGAQLTADGWRLPPLEMLDNTPEVEFSQADNIKKAKLIEDALASYGVEGKVVQINVGPTVTQFGIEPGWDRKLKEIKEKDKNGDVQRKIEEIAKTRVKVDRITSLSNDLSLALAAPSIRIEAPVPGKSVVGIEVPNTNIGVVSLRSVVESNVFQKSEAKTKLTVALGKGAGGESVIGDLAKMPHLLIAGATGSGKTVCIHSLISCLLLYNTPDDVRFIMIDPKRVELTSYNSLPHLATPVIVDTNRALLALRGLAQEMDKRYQILAAVRGARNIEAYNKARPREKLPYLILVIDELADLMMTSGEEVERTLCRLAQLARAVGIHLIVATQRPSVDVVTGLIKANFPTRISFAVTSQVDSRTILDSGGAEKLLGRGDMLYMPTEAAKPKRLQGCFLSDAEIERMVYFWNNQKKEVANQLRMDDLVDEEEAREEHLPADPLLDEARKLAAEHGNISTSFLQRHLRIGYPRAARLMELLEEENNTGTDSTAGPEDADADEGKQ